LNDQHSFSFLFNSKKKFDTQFNVYSFGYQFQMAESFQLLTSYQNLSGISNIGAGFVWSPGPLQIHMILENILVADVFDAKNLSVQMGLILNFGRN